MNKDTEKKSKATAGTENFCPQYPGVLTGHGDKITCPYLVLFKWGCLYKIAHGPQFIKTDQTFNTTV